VLIAAALLAGAARAADPVTTRTAAVLELQAAIADELRAMELLRKEPPRYDTAVLRIRASLGRLWEIRKFLSTAPGAMGAEVMVDQAWLEDVRANDASWRDGAPAAIALLEKALATKRAVLPLARAAKDPPPVAQCSDGKDNDGDGVRDWKLEPGCTSSRDVRESTRFTCGVESTIVGGRLALSGSCSGAFSEIDVRMLDGVTLNGRWDIKHAPSCGPTKPDGFRCKTKDGAQNPQHLIDVRLATTSKGLDQRVQLRFFDVRKRLIGRFVFPQPSAAP